MSKLNKTEKKVKAQELLKARVLRTQQEQIDLLDKKFGKGNGAKKERARLLKQIGESK